MGVVVNGVPMPDKCGDCHFARLGHNGQGTWVCVAAYPERWKPTEDHRTKPGWCPLTEETIHFVYLVTVVPYENDTARDPVSFVFDNQLAANACFQYFAKDERCGKAKIFMCEEPVYGSFMIGGNQYGTDN